jgi:enediyne biosynthesis protein E4
MSIFIKFSCFYLLFNKLICFSQYEQFIAIDSKVTQIDFVNNIKENNLINIYHYEYLYNGAGVAAGDINNDGLIDLYFISNLEDNHLYLNRGNFYFEDITYSSNTKGEPGYCTGVSMIDINQDGFLDIYICKSVLTDSKMRENELLINNGDLTFTNRAVEYGLNDNGYSVQAYFLDIENDGDLDLYLLNQPINLKESNNIKVRKNNEGASIFYTDGDLTYSSNKVYRNDKGKFKDISKLAGIQTEAFSLSAVVSDFNGDFYPDIYVCNDFIKPDNLFINNGKGQFIDSFQYYFDHSSFSSRGSDFADLNNDGLQDLLVLDVVPKDHFRKQTLGVAQNQQKFTQMNEIGLQSQISTNVLQLNSGNKSFSEIAHLSGIAYTDWSWSPLMADFNNDGWRDIFVTNGLLRDFTNNDYRKYLVDSVGKVNLIGTDFTAYLNLIPSTKIQNFLFKNNKDLTFSDVSKTWNVGEPSNSTGAIYADLNNDGLIDLVTNNINEKATVLMNIGSDGGRNNFIKIKLKDPLNKSMYGTKVKVYNKIQWHLKQGQILEFQPTRGYLSSSEPILHFGLGDKKVIEKIEIIWPDGSFDEYYDISDINKQLEFTKKSSSKKYSTNKSHQFKDLSHLLHKEMSHQENEFDDFISEPLLIQKFSTEGPAVAVGDINNDGLDDVFIGGAKGRGGKLFIQKLDGSFMKSNQNFDELIESEDVNAIFFDINNDGYNDLYVVTGGNENPINSSLYKDRVYINDKKNKLIYQSILTPELHHSSKAIAISDIDNDGYLDVFVGGRLLPGNFPYSPTSCFLKNEKGSLIDNTSKWLEGQADLGMITDATFFDLNNDGVKELIVVGEWMPIKVFEFEKGKFIDKSNKYGLLDTKGWWQSVSVLDINNDSIPDILAGNMGLNSFFQVAKHEPIEMYYQDLDQNGKADPIVTKMYNGIAYPIYSKDKLISQIPDLKNKFKTYASYAKSPYDSIFVSIAKNDKMMLKMQELENCIFIGNKNFVFKKIDLPRLVQNSTIRSFVSKKLENNTVQLISGGNFYGLDIHYGRLDASKGFVLEFQGKNLVNNYESQKVGLKLDGDVRKIIPFKSLNSELYLITRNNSKFSLYQKNK